MCMADVFIINCIENAVITRTIFVKQMENNICKKFKVLSKWINAFSKDQSIRSESDAVLYDQNLMQYYTCSKPFNY